MEEKMATVLNEMSEYLSISQLIVPPIDLQKQFMEFVKQVDKSKVVLHINETDTKLYIFIIMNNIRRNPSLYMRYMKHLQD